MNDAAITGVAVMLAGAGVAAEAQLLWRFIRDWRIGRSENATRVSDRREQAQRTARSRSEAGRSERRSVLVFGACVLAPAMAAAQGTGVDAAKDAEPPAAAPSLVISTDRPSFSDGTGIVPMGHFQLETGYTFTFRNRDDVETQKHNGPEILGRVALVEDRFELRVISSAYVWSRSNDGTGSGYSSVEGWSDVALGFKLKLADQSGWLPRIALGAQTTVGTGSDNISSQIAEPIVKFIWSYDLGQSFGEDWKGMGVGGNLNAAWPTSGGERFTQGQGSVYFTFPLFEDATGFVEYYVVGPNSKGTDAAHYADFGGVYLLNSRVQLDARVGVGLNDEADNAFVGLGVSFLF